MNLETYRNRLFQNCTVNPVTGCWEWPHDPKDPWTYGALTIKWKGKPRYVAAHRLMLLFFCGFDIDNPLAVCHACDYKPCMNPRHLFIATCAENNYDMKRKGQSWAKRHIPIVHGAHAVLPPSFFEIGPIQPKEGLQFERTVPLSRMIRPDSIQRTDQHKNERKRRLKRPRSITPKPL